MIALTVANEKGGVGKTMLAVHVAEGRALRSDAPGLFTSCTNSAANLGGLS